MKILRTYKKKGLIGAVCLMETESGVLRVMVENHEGVKHHISTRKITYPMFSYYKNLLTQAFNDMNMLKKLS